MALFVVSGVILLMFFSFFTRLKFYCFHFPSAEIAVLLFRGFQISLVVRSIVESSQYEGYFFSYYTLVLILMVSDAME